MTTSREQLAGTLRSAFGEGLLSEPTLSHRLSLLFGHPLVDPQHLVGDLSVRSGRRHRRRRLSAFLDAATAHLRRSAGGGSLPPVLLLGLNWSGGPHDDILLGRDARVCDIVLDEKSVSRRHARLRYCDGHWIIHDLRSTNGTAVNGVCIGRSQLRHGDQLTLGDQRLDVD